MMSRFEATQAITRRLSDEDLVIASLGNTKYDLHGAKDRPLNFYMWNSMGMASSMGLGMAMACPDRRCVILQGDGGVLMNMGSLSTLAWRAPKNVVHVCWDNRMYEITGRQPTATAGTTDLAEVARACGYPKVARAETLEAFERAVDTAFAEDGPWFIHALVNDERAPRERRPPRSPTFIKHRFMSALGLTEH